MTLDRKKDQLRIWNDTLQVILVSVAYYLFDKLGFGAKKGFSVLSNINNLAESIRSKNVSLDELTETLSEEYGITITQTKNGILIEKRESKK